MASKSSSSKDKDSGKVYGEFQQVSTSSDNAVQCDTSELEVSVELADIAQGASQKLAAVPEDLQLRIQESANTNSSFPRQLDPVSKQETHYVLVIHGTFDSPTEGIKPWYFRNPGERANFCTIMTQNFKGSVLNTDSIWRTLPGNKNNIKLSPEVPYPFFWEGANTHEARSKAGKKLAKLINFIAKADPSARIHLVGHSHGGNVILKGVSKYLDFLRMEAGVEYNDIISKEFWSTHKQSFDSIAKHQKLSGVGWKVWLMGPFATVKRPWAGEEDLGLFHWGYWELTDWLLGLPKYRQQKYLRKKWATCPSTNALGNIVFMGTPFYSKYWEKHAFWLMALNVLISTVVMFFSVMALAMLVNVVLTYYSQETDFNDWIAAFWWVLALVCFGFSVFSALTGKRFKEGNLYHSERRAWSPSTRALVLNAGKLDEAALALSTEPLVRAYLLPQVKAMLTPDPWRTLRPFPVRGVKKSAYNLYRNVLLVIWNILFAMFYLVLHVLNYVLVPAFSNALLRLFMSLGFGLQKGELDNAGVFVEENLKLSPDTHSIFHWNVQKILTAASYVQMLELNDLGESAEELRSAEKVKETFNAEESKDVSERWKFLWNDEELERRAKESLTMQRLFSQIDQMPHHPKATRTTFEKELKLICVTLEERYKDMAGNVELSHGSYFRNKAVIAAISFFVMHGQLPMWASKVGQLESSFQVPVGNEDAV